MERQDKDYLSGCDAFSLNSQSVSFLQAYLLLELICSALLAETGGKCPLVLSVNPVDPISLSSSFAAFKTCGLLCLLEGIYLLAKTKTIVFCSIKLY